MNTHQFKRTIALLCAGLQIFVSPYAWAKCFTGTTTDPDTVEGLTGVFSVMKPGTIDGAMLADTQCNVAFYSSDKLGVPNLVNGGKVEGGKSYKCQSYNYDSATNSFKAGVDVVASGYYTKARAPINYVPSTGVTTKFKDADGNEKDPIFKGVTATLPAGNWTTVSVEALGSTGANLTLSDGVKIKTLSVSGCSNGTTLTLVGGSTVYIDKLSWEAGCKLVVSGTGAATLNILGTDSSNVNSDGSLKAGTTADGFALQSGKTCFNYSDSACATVTSSDSWKSGKTDKAVYDLMNDEKPSNLQINLLHGNFTTQGAFAMAGGIYVADGLFNMGNGTPVTIVGQVLAKGIKGQNNTGSSFFAKTSPMDTGGTETPGNNFTRYDDYSIAAAGVSTEVKVTKGDKSTTTDGYVFLAVQREGTMDKDGKGVLGVAGDLAIYTLNADGSYGTRQALASTSKISKGETITWQNKYDKIKTSSGTSLTPSVKPDTLLNQYFIAAKNVGFSTDAVFARPWRTAPALVDATGTAAIFATDDGVLYSVNNDGSLNWGWMPNEIEKVLANKLDTTAIDTDKTLKDEDKKEKKLVAYKALIDDFHPWGQLRVVQQGTTKYVTGTALGGALHFSLNTGIDGKTLDSIAFLDYQDGKVSPGGEAFSKESVAQTWKPLWLQNSERTSWPYGGDAPAPRSFDFSSNKVAYIVDGKLVVRNIDGVKTKTETETKAETETPTYKDLKDEVSKTITPSSNLLYWNSGVLFVGTSDGKLVQLDEAGKVKTIYTIKDEEILGVEGAQTAAGEKLLLAQTWTSVYALTWNGSTWISPWHIKAGEKSTGDSVGTTDDFKLPLDAKLTALPSIAPLLDSGEAGAVLIPYTANRASVSESSSELSNSKQCTNGEVSAWSFGPLDALTGNILQAKTDHSIKMGNIGSGTKRTQNNVRTGAGEATGISIIMFNDGNKSYISQESMASGIGTTHADQAKIQAGQKLPTKDGDVGEQPASGRGLHSDPKTQKTRLNWRELTNFY